MAKQKRKPRLSEAQLYRPGANAVVQQPKIEQSLKADTSSRVPTQDELAAEYHYVINDLKRIGILALVMLALLIGLAFILI